MSDNVTQSRASFVFEEPPSPPSALVSRKSIISTEGITSRKSINHAESTASRRTLLSVASSSSISLAREKIIDRIKGKTWIDKIKNSFIEAAGKEDEDITLDQWCQSNLKYLIDENILTDEQMVEYFQQIDANTDEHVSWSELVAYLMMHQKSLTGTLIDKKLKLTFNAPNALTIKKSQRASICLRVRYIPSLEQVITLTESTLTFWSKNCIPQITFSDKDRFVDFCCIPSLFKLAIAKQNRQIIFYDLRQHQKLDYFISATLDSSSVTHFDEDETRSAIASCRRRRIPLFNTPTAMESAPDHPYIFIGDEEGRIEVFTIFVSKGPKSEYSSSRVKCVPVHTQAVSQIMYIPKLDVFASSSLDGTICIWSFSFKTHDFKIETRFEEPQHLPITGFVYEYRNHDYVYMTPSHCFGVWRAGMDHSQTVDTKDQVISTMAVCSLSAENNFLVAVTKTNFFTIYKFPNMEVCENYFMGLLHELCPPTSSMVADGFLYLVGAFVSSWRIENGTGDGLRACQNPIVTVQVNDLFKRVITCDKKAGIANWDITTGKREFAFDIDEPGADVTCFSLDVTQRRAALGFSNGIVHIITSNTGNVLYTIEKGVLEGGCRHLCFSTLFGQSKLLCATGKKTAVLFDDLKGNRMSFHRNFVGHSENVDKVVVLKERVILTIGSEHEMFLWSPQQQNPIMRYNLPNDPSIAVDIPNNDSLFLAGDVCGFVHIMKLESTTPIKSFNIFKMYIKSAITSIALSKTTPHVFIGNMHGYVRAMYFENNDDFNDIKMFRAHPMSIINIAFSESEKVFITASLDQEVKLWTLEPFSCIGSVGKLQKWKISNQKTWLGDQTVEIDETHFQKPEEHVVEEEEEVVEHVEEESKHELPPLPPFTLEAAQRMYDTSEDQYIQGNKLLQKIRTELAQPPKSARVIKPVVPKMCFADLIERRHMENTITYVKSCREITPRMPDFPRFT